MKRQYRTVFLSDAHLGFRGTQADALHSFLQGIECETLVLVGDIFDLWAMRKRVFWTVHCTAVVRRVLNMVKKGTRVLYLPGNHDENIRTLLPFSLGENQIDVADEGVYETLSGKRLLLIHGDQFDWVVGNMKWLAVLGSAAYDILLHMNGILHFVRAHLGMPYFSLAAYLKAKAKRAVSFVKDFETAVMGMAKSRNCDGAVVGHIHTPKIHDHDGFLYINCGDWVESLTAVVETLEGELQLLSADGSILARV